MAKGRRLTFFTLTSRAASEKLTECIDHLWASFRRLRSTACWGKAVRGGIATIEITRGAAGDHWHVHIHGLFVGGWLEHKRFSDLWRVASRGSHVVHIRAVRNGGKELEYVASYAAKGWDRKLLNDPDRCDESITALKGRRLLMTFGDWYKSSERDRPADVRVYRHVGRLVDIARAAAKGEAWAAALMLALGVQTEGGDGSVRFVQARAGKCRDPVDAKPAPVGRQTRGTGFENTVQEATS